MRLLHTSDWHLGRRLNEYALIDEQFHALEQIARMCREERADALLIAGDLYDRAIPPEEAVGLFSDFLHRMSKDVGIPIVAIAGNHDSAERLGFGAEFLARGGVHLKTRLADREKPIVLDARGERVEVYALPYLEPARARAELADDALRTHDAAVKAALSSIRARNEARGGLSVLLAHLFACGGSESPDSERSLEIGGAAQVELSSLEGFSYVALGHLHAPQRVGGREDVRYSGSLLKYSVSESKQRKGVTLIELSGKGVIAHELPLTQKRDVVRLEAPLKELLESDRFEPFRDAYVEATFTDKGYHLDVAPRLRERFRFLLSAVPKTLAEAETQLLSTVDVQAALRDTRALLEGFWGHVVGEAEPLLEDHHAVFADVLGALEGVAIADPLPAEADRVSAQKEVAA